MQNRLQRVIQANGGPNGYWVNFKRFKIFIAVPLKFRKKESHTIELF
jgi:hypothetical protein